MALQILGIAACGGLLIAFLPRMRHSIHHLRIVYRVAHKEDIQERERRAAEVFAYEVDEMLQRHRRDTRQQLIVDVDRWGGTHCDLAAINPRTGEPRMRPSVAKLHGYPICEEPTEPNMPVIAGTPVHSGSFARYPIVPAPIVRVARPTVILPTLSEEGAM